MKKYILNILLVFLCYSSYAQETNKTILRIGGGFGTGFRNFNGFGALAFIRKNKIEGNLALGFTGYNGSKMSLGSKYYIWTDKKINPLLSLNYTYTHHENVTIENNHHEELYYTSNNQYAIAGLGFYLRTKKMMYEHHFIFGYTQVLNNYKIIPDSKNLTNTLFHKIDNVTKSGFMFTYTIYFSVPKKVPMKNK